MMENKGVPILTLGNRGLIFHKPPFIFPSSGIISLSSSLYPSWTIIFYIPELIFA
jgi:hypothetical protein